MEALLGKARQFETFSYHVLIGLYRSPRLHLIMPSGKEIDPMLDFVADARAEWGFATLWHIRRSKPRGF
jgi:hypothetical protein